MPTRLAAHLRGRALLETPALNKGTAFTLLERQALGLDGLLPPAVETVEEQSFRAYKVYLRKPDDLERHIYLRQLQDTNEVLFYRLLLDHIEEMLPIVYTPVVAEACQEFSHIYRRPRGLIISYPLRDQIESLLRNRPNKEVSVIVVTDGERILGIGDQGVGGLGIPIGKLSLYTLIGGVPPAETLPVILDVGTNNEQRLGDPEYLGWRHERITGEAYYDFVDRFVNAVKKELPDTLLQWEDFSKAHARPILDRYRDELVTFNDDIQGTAAVTAGAIFSAVRASGGRLRDQQVVILGAGSAGIGVADSLAEALVADGLSEAEARPRFWLINSGGLLDSGRTDLSEQQRRYAQPADLLRWTDGRALIATGSPFADVEYRGRKVRVSQCNNVFIFPAMGLVVSATRARRVTDGMFLAAARVLAQHSPALGDPAAPLLPALTALRRAAVEIAFAVAEQAAREGLCVESSRESLRNRIISLQWAPVYQSYL